MLSHTSVEKSSLLRPGQVVGSVMGLPGLAALATAEIGRKCDIVEFRADGFPLDCLELEAAMQNSPRPALLTVRRPDEGGMNQWSGADRLLGFGKLLRFARLIDVEIASLPDFQTLVRQAGEKGIPVVASFHDFTGTPQKSVLKTAADKAMSLGADAVKFATTLRNTGDLAVLASLQEEAGIYGIPMATMGMGPMGRASRLLLGSLGSVLNYGYLDQPTIPGQWPAARLRALIRELRGEEEGPAEEPAEKAE